MATRNLNPEQTELIRLYLYEEFDNTLAPDMLSKDLIYSDQGYLYPTEKGICLAEYLISEIIDRDFVIFKVKIFSFEISFRIRANRI